MVAGVRDQYSGDCERVQVVDSTGDAGCSVTLPERPRRRTGPSPKVCDNTLIEDLDSIILTIIQFLQTCACLLSFYW